MKREVSIVFPVYNEEQILQDEMEKFFKEIEAFGIDYELIAVENGSKDRTPHILKGLATQYP
jgi:glycosyltransferase involved in cell wall biosynthesis